MSTPGIGELVAIIVEERLLDVWTAFPGKVVSYDADAQTAVIRPGIKLPVSQDEAGSYAAELEIPDLDDVPVRMPWAGGGWKITAGLQAGDTVVCHVMTRSLSEWLASPGRASRVAPGRHHDINDVWCEPWAPAQGTTASLKIEGHGASIELTAAGDVKLNGGTQTAARTNDEIVITATTDPAFWTVMTALYTLAGFTLSPTGSIKGKINTGANNVYIG